jgi:hypothetical protein
MRHLAEDEIQTYLDTGGDGIMPDFLEHLRTCRQCRTVLADYEALYDGLADKSGFEIPRDLAAAVVARLALKPVRRLAAVPGDFVLVAGAILVMLLAVAVFTDLRPLIDAASAAGRPIIEYVSPHLESADDPTTSSGRFMTIFVTGAGVLACVGALDLIFKRRPADHPIRPAR